MTNVTRAADVPDSHKIAVYDALCRYFEGALDSYYTEEIETDPRYDTGVASTKTECIGIEYMERSLYVVMAIEGWADLQGFEVDLPTLTRGDHGDDGTALTLRG